MKADKPDARVAARYALLQLPGTAAVVAVLALASYWIDLPLWLSALIVAVWVLKEALLFPFVWRAYDARQEGGAQGMVGLRGTVAQRLDPRGVVRLRGELWQAEPAEGAGPLEAGAEVEVVAVQGLVVRVRGVRGKDGDAATPA